MTLGPEEVPDYSVLELLVAPLVFSRPWGLDDAVSTWRSEHKKEMLHHRRLDQKNKCVKAVHSSDHSASPYVGPTKCRTPEHFHAVPKWPNSKDG